MLNTHYRQGKLFDSEGKPVRRLNPHRAVKGSEGYDYGNLESKITYYPKSFSDKHGGKTKSEIIGQTLTEFPGWQVCLVEDLPNLPAEGAGKTIGGRKQVEAGLTPEEYLWQTKNDSQYSGEDGATPEGWLIQAILHLEATNKVFDDYQGKGKLSFLTGSYFPSKGAVLNMAWHRDFGEALWHGSNPGRSSENNSSRRSVRVRKRISSST